MSLATVESNRTVARDLGFAGAVWRLETNSLAIIRAARTSFPGKPLPSPNALSLKLLVDRSIAATPPWPPPYFRGRDHLVLAAYAGGAMLFDLLARYAIGVFSPGMANDTEYWRRVIFPVAAGVVSPAIGVVPLHSATLVRNGRGLLISGLSGTGKSTLSVALAQRGFALLADDWTYFSLDPAGVTAHSLPVPVKLLPDADRFFPRLARRLPSPSLNGELAFELDPGFFAAKRTLSCRPQRIVFFQRKPGTRTRWLRLTPAQVENQFRPALERIPECLHGGRERQHAIIAALAQVEAWSLACGGTPDSIADEVMQLTSDMAAPTADCTDIGSHFEIPDLMRRFVPAPVVGEFEINGIVMRVETDMPEVSEQLRASPLENRNTRCDLVCTVLKDDAVPSYAAHASDAHLSCEVFPATACVMADFARRRIVAFVNHAFANRRTFLTDLFELWSSKIRESRLAIDHSSPDCSGGESCGGPARR